MPLIAFPPRDTVNPSSVRQKPKGRQYPPLTVFACDTVARIQNGLRRYIFTFICPHSRFVIATSSLSSWQSAFALDALCQLLHKPPTFTLSDNGSEFLGKFHGLDKHAITHWWTYPKSPKMNAHAERFNRTIQENLVDYHEDLLFFELAEFNHKMAEWLVSYNDHNINDGGVDFQLRRLSRALVTVATAPFLLAAAYRHLRLGNPVAMDGKLKGWHIFLDTRLARRGCW